MPHAHSSEESHETLSLSKAADMLLEECRMVLPGIQAMLGFQFVTVFSPGFEQKLDAAQQRIHLAAICLMMLAIAMIMTPAALHRREGPREVTETFVLLATRLLIASMVPLAIAVSLEFHLIAAIILDRRWAAWLGTGAFALFALLWFVLPRVERLQRIASGRR